MNAEPRSADLLFTFSGPEGLFVVTNDDGQPGVEGYRRWAFSTMPPFRVTSLEMDVA